MTQNRHSFAMTASLASMLSFVIGGGVIHAAPDNLKYVNVVQDSNGQNHIHKSALMRYPLGRIGLWSIDHGEFADCVSRGLRLYPCIDTVANKGNSNDWRGGISGSPSVVTVAYKTNEATKGSSVDLTVTPHVSVYRYHLADASNYQAIVLMAGDSKVTNLRWDSNTVTVIDDRTVQVIISNSKNHRSVYHYIRFNARSVGHGMMDGDTLADRAGTVTGDKIGAYLKFNKKEVVAAVSVSHTSMAQAKTYIDNEFATMDFAMAADDLKKAWITKLGKVEAQGPDMAMRQLYTALYTVYVNTIDATENPYYKSYKPLLTISSSDYWQAMGLYPRCDWDMSRGVYPLIALIDPDLFTHILNAYQAQYDRDGKFWPNWDPFSASGFRESLYLGNFSTLAMLQGISEVDYKRLKDSLADHIRKNYQSPMFDLGYVPAESKDASPASRTLEYATQLQGLAILARTLGDSETYNKYYHYRTNYMNLYDATNQQFRVRTTNGDWGPMGKKFFEGSGVSYGFCAPHDPYGLFGLYGASNAVSKIDNYLRNHADYNDYQLIYLFLPIFADRADETESLVRTGYVPKFDTLIMTEGFWPGSRGCYYTDNAGPLACCLLGLYWIPTSGGTWMLTTPSLDKIVIHGKTDLTIQTVNNSPDNHYIRSIQLNGAAYPSYIISAKALTSGNQDLTFTLTNSPSRIGDLYLSSTDGEVLKAATEGHGSMKFEIDPLAETCAAKVYSSTKPSQITLNGTEFKNWTYDPATKLVSLHEVAKGTYRVTVISTEISFAHPTAWLVRVPAASEIPLARR